MRRELIIISGILAVCATPFAVTYAISFYGFGLSTWMSFFAALGAEIALIFILEAANRIMEMRIARARKKNDLLNKSILDRLQNNASSATR